MPLQNVPWATGNGSLNPVEGARMSLHAATKEARGILTPRAMQVVALPVPGSAVRILHGACVTPNDYLKSQEFGAQSYVMRETSYTDFEIPATGSSGGATRYLIARIMDPQYAGPMPEDEQNGPYNEYALVSSISKLSYPHVPLAKISQPANTGTITNSMITDIREVAIPRHDWAIFARPRVVADNSAGMNLTVTNADGGEYFPGGDGSSNGFRVRIPEWATRVAIDARWSSVSYAGGRDLRGYYWVEFGDEYRDRTWPNKRQFEFATQKFAFNAPNTSDHKRNDWGLMDAVVVPKKLRGKMCTFVFKAGITGQTGVSMDEYTGVGMRLDFLETADRADGVLTP